MSETPTPMGKGGNLAESIKSTADHEPEPTVESKAGKKSKSSKKHKPFAIHSPSGSPWGASDPIWSVEWTPPVVEEETEGDPDAARELYRTLVHSPSFALRVLRTDDGLPVAAHWEDGVLSATPFESGHFQSAVDRFVVENHVLHPGIIATLIRMATAQARRRNGRVVRLVPRIADDGDGGTVFSLDGHRQVIYITQDGVHVGRANRPLFLTLPLTRPIDPPKLLPPPSPVPPHIPDAYWQFVRIQPNDRIMLEAELVQQLVRPFSPKPVTTFIAPEGDGKSTQHEFYVRTLDDLVPWSIGIPSDPRDFPVLETRRQHLAFDNVSHVPDDTSDWVCRLVTGSGTEHRELFTNLDARATTSIPKVSVNSISVPGTRPDLLRRSIVYHLIPFGPNDVREDPAVVRDRFLEQRPDFIGALAVQAALVKRQLAGPRPHLPPGFDMTSYAEVGVALCIVRGISPETFLNAYRAKIRVSTGHATEDAYVDWVERLLGVACALQGGSFHGRARDLADIALDADIPAPGREGRPTPSTVGKSLMRAQRTLEKLGWKIARLEDTFENAGTYSILPPPKPGPESDTAKGPTEETVW